MTKQQSSAGGRGRGADNRQRLVDAGHEVLSEKGLEAATVKEIARVAGVSPGLFHYYFASKDELLLAVFEEAGKRFVKERLVGEVGDRATARDRVEGTVRFVEEIARREPQLFRLRYELYALGLRNPEFLPAVGEQLASVKANIAGVWRGWFPDADEAHAQALAAVILACFDGLALQRIAQPEATLASAYDLLRKLMEDEGPAPDQDRKARAQ